MRNRDIYSIQQNVQELADLKEQLEDSVELFLNNLKVIEKELDREYSTSHILGQTRTILESIDTDTIFDFVDELEAEISTLYYKHKKVLTANQMSTYPKPNSPSYYKPNFRGELMTLSPTLVKSLKHVGILLVLGAVSTGLIPLYTIIVGAITSVTPTLPLLAQSAIVLFLPVIGAAVSKFDDIIKQNLQNEENAKLVAVNTVLISKNADLTSKNFELISKNIELVSKNVVLSGSVENASDSKNLG